MSQLSVEGVVQKRRRDVGSAKEGTPRYDTSAHDRGCTFGATYIGESDIAAEMDRPLSLSQHHRSKLASCSSSSDQKLLVNLP